MPSPKSKSPKSKSPKSKGSPKKSGSPKNSPKQKSADEPPIDQAIQTESRGICYFCSYPFECETMIQAHIALMDHFAPNSPQLQECRACKSKVMYRDSGKHKCVVMKSTFLNYMAGSGTLDFGPPYRCLFCRASVLGSRIELAMHLLCYHNPKRIANRCGMCTFNFDEPNPAQMPNPPSLPPNATEEQKAEHDKLVKLLKEQFMCATPETFAPGLENLRIHILTEHVPPYMLWNRRNILEDSNQRFPYACPLCGWILKTNHALHAHVLCCHGNPTTIENDLKICAMCGFAAVNDAGLNQHVLMIHTDAIKRLGNIWIKHELLMNSTDTSVVCIFCWEKFRFDFQLQAHILIAHTTSNALKCGWCKIDFLSCPDPVLAFMIMQHHELNHARVLHEKALEVQLTFEPLKELLPEVPDKQVLISARLEAGDKRSDSPGGKGKKNSKSPPSKKSPKSQKSDSKKGSSGKSSKKK